MRLQNQVILITGSTTGIGAAMARRFVAEGARVILHGRDVARGEKLREELGAEKAAFIAGDLADENHPAQLAAAALECFGKIDALVNNAALTTRAHIADTDTAFFDRMLAVNLRAPLMLIRALLPALKKTQGCVLNIGSILAHCGQSNLVAYSISKGGLMTLTRNLADSLVYQADRFLFRAADGLPEEFRDQVSAQVDRVRTALAGDDAVALRQVTSVLRDTLRDLNPGVSGSPFHQPSDRPDQADPPGHDPDVSVTGE